MPCRGDHPLTAARDLCRIVVGQIGAAVFAGEDATAQRRPRQHAQAEFARHWQQLMFDAAFDQAVLDLQRHQRRPAAQVGQGLQLRHAPGRRIADAQIEHLARLHQMLQPAHHFVRCGGEIPGVQVQQVDPVGGKLAQAGFDRANQVQAMIAAGIDVVRIACHGEFGGQHEAFASVLDQLAEDAFGAAVGVVHRGVDEVAAAVGIGVEDALGFDCICAPAPGFAEGHGAQRQWRDAQAGAAEQALVVQ